MGDVPFDWFCDHRFRRIEMSTNSTLTALSNGLADAVAAAAASVVQVHGRRRPASGVVYENNVVVTSARALGREDGLHVRRHDGTVFDAELAGWDPTTGLAVLSVAGMEKTQVQTSDETARVRPPGIG